MSLRVHFRDGRTESFDLSDPEDAKRLRVMQRDPERAISAVTVLRDGVAHSMRAPEKGRAQISADEDEHGERVRLYADDLILSMMVHARHKAAKYSVERGRRVFAREE